MARTIAVIAQTMFTAKAAESELSGLTSTSQTAIWRLWIYIVAACINVFEQLQDAFKIELETIASEAISGTPQWVQARTFDFQYSATIQQVVEIVDTEIVYPTVDDTLKIVTRCSVITDANKIVKIKVAKATSTTDDTPIPLAAGEKTALNNYWDLIGFAGIKYNVVNLDPDRIGIVAEIFYKGQYASTIEADVISALDNYLATIPFDGYVNVLAIEDALQALQGVSDIKLATVSGRSQSQAFAGRYKFYDLATSVNDRRYNTEAGYCIQEDEPSQTFADTLTFTPA